MDKVDFEVHREIEKRLIDAEIKLGLATTLLRNANEIISYFNERPFVQSEFIGLKCMAWVEAYPHFHPGYPPVGEKK